MTDDITRNDIRELLKAYGVAQTPPRAQRIIDHVPALLDEDEAQQELVQQLNGQVDALSEQVESLEHELKVANAKIVEMQRGRLPDPEQAPDHKIILDFYKIASEKEHDYMTFSCLQAVPRLVEENARLRQDSELLGKLAEAARVITMLARE